MDTRNALTVGRNKTGLMALLASLSASVALVPGLAFAQATAIDVSDGVDQLTAAGVAIATIGGAMLVLAGIAAAYKWARAAFF